MCNVGGMGVCMAGVCMVGGGGVHGRRDGHRILLECILVIFAHRHLFKIKI